MTPASTTMCGKRFPHIVVEAGVIVEPPPMIGQRCRGKSGLPAVDECAIGAWCIGGRVRRDMIVRPDRAAGRGKRE